MDDILAENHREELEKLLLNKEYRALRKKMEDMNVVDIAFISFSEFYRKIWQRMYLPILNWMTSST